MRFIIPFLGKTKSSYLDKGITDYAGRLKRYAAVELPLLKCKVRQNDSDEVVKLQEAELLLEREAAVKKKILLALDPGGKTVSSEEMADMIRQWQETGVENVLCFIGGHLGLHETVLHKADLSLSLSQLTFTHEMSRLILLEQLYRAWTIKAGHKYHN